MQLDPGVLHPDPDANLYPDVNPGKDKSKNKISYCDSNLYATDPYNDSDSNLDATDPCNDSDFDNLDAADSDPDLLILIVPIGSAVIPMPS